MPTVGISNAQVDNSALSSEKAYGQEYVKKCYMKILKTQVVEIDISLFLSIGMPTLSVLTNLSAEPDKMQVLT